MKYVPTRPPSDRLATGIERLSAVLREGLWRLAWPRELTATQAQILQRLDLRPGDTLHELARALGIRDSTASEAVSTLGSRGLVEKRKDPNDRRRRRLFLTESGRESRATVGATRSFLAEALDTLEPDEQESLVVALQKIIRSLQVAGKIPVEGTCTTCRFFRPHAHDGRRNPHHCDYVNAAFGDRDLRFDCADHEPEPALIPTD
jgi:DNA-binding MarR family transcriptional regulator